MGKIFTTFIAICLLGAGSVQGQSSASVFAELGGPGLASINFDSRFTGRNDGLGGRAGIGGFSVDGNGAAFIPLGLNYLLGKDERNYFEFGAGLTAVVGDAEDIEDEENNFATTFGHFHFGYRLQPADGGFTFRAGITPVFGEWGFLPYFFSLSFGYKF